MTDEQKVEALIAEFRSSGYGHWIDGIETDGLKTLQARAADLFKSSGYRFRLGLTPQLIGMEGRRVEVVDSYGNTRRFKVGKSTGWIPCHIELHNARSTGGGPAYGTPYKSIRIIR